MCDLSIPGTSPLTMYMKSGLIKHLFVQKVTNLEKKNKHGHGSMLKMQSVILFWQVLS